VALATTLLLAAPDAVAAATTRAAAAPPTASAAAAANARTAAETPAEAAPRLAPVTVVPEGGSVTLATTHDVTVDDALQWRRSTDGGQTWADIVGATDPELTLSRVTLGMDGWQYRMRVVRMPLVLDLEPTTLQVRVVLPTVTTHPSDETVGPGGTATFTAAYGGTDAPTTTGWESSTDGGGTWTPVAGATQARLTIGPVSEDMSGTQYRARFTNVAGSVATDPATLTVLINPPVVVQHPVDVVTDEYTTATFTAAYTSMAITQARWQHSSDGGASWQLVGAPEGATLTLDPVMLAMDGWQYRLRLDNGTSPRWTDPATLTVRVARPVVTEHPADAAGPVGGSVTFAGAYGGTDAPTMVQWQVSTDGGLTFPDVPGGTGPTLLVDDLTEAMDGRLYRVRYRNEAGDARSDPARLTVRERLDVTHDPADASAPEGGTATFTAGFTGDPSTVVQWEQREGAASGEDGWADVPGATEPTLVVHDVTLAMTGRQYRVRVTGEDGTVRSAPATLTVTVVLPTVTEHPADLEVTEGDDVTFAAAYGGTDAPTSAQWEVSSDISGRFQELLGATSPTYVGLPAASSHNGWRYRVRFTNAAGSVWSEPATLTVRDARPVVTQHPADQATAERGSVTFDAAYGGTDAPTSVQWQMSANGGVTYVSVAGGTELPLVLDDVTLAMDGRRYRVRFTNPAGSAWSEPATLSVAVAPPVVTQHPADRSATEGGSAAFTAAYGGTDAPTTAQWQVSGDGTTFADVPGATAPALVLDDLRRDQDGERYRVRFTNAAGSALSDPATLTVTPARPVVTEQPADQDVPEGGVATFAAAYTSTTASTARWQVSEDGGQSWRLVAGGTGSTLTLDPVTLAMDGWQYRLRLDNEGGTRWTEAATLTVRVVRPVVTEQPADQVVAVGETATFDAAYGGTDAPTSVQWQVSTDGGATFPYVPGGTSLPLALHDVTDAMDGRLYRVRFTNSAGSAWSEPARLTVLREVPALTLRVTPRAVLVDALPVPAG